MISATEWILYDGVADGRPSAKTILERLATARILLCECGGQPLTSNDACSTCRMYAVATGVIDVDQEGDDHA